MEFLKINLKGKTAVVTGAGRGIGRCIALALSQAGASVALAARTESELRSAAEEIATAGGRAVAVPADVASEDDVRRLFERTERELGPAAILINNAGAGLFGPVETFSAADFDRVIATNLRGAFLCAREAFRRMKPRRAGTIINIASVVGFKGYPEQAAYTASKHGVMGLTKSLAAEGHPHGLRVSAVLPGGVDTDLAGAARPDLDRSVLLQSEDIARTVLFLLSLPERAAIDEIYIRRSASKPF